MLDPTRLATWLCFERLGSYLGAHVCMYVCMCVCVCLLARAQDPARLLCSALHSVGHFPSFQLFFLSFSSLMSPGRRWQCARSKLPRIWECPDLSLCVPHQVNKEKSRRRKNVKPSHGICNVCVLVCLAASQPPQHPPPIHRNKQSRMELFVRVISDMMEDAHAYLSIYSSSSAFDYPR